SSSVQSSVTANPSNATTNPIIIEYVVTASTSLTCLSTDTVLVTVNPLPVISVTDPAICSGENVQIEATATTSPMNFEWVPHADLSCTNCPDPFVSPSTTTTYS